MNGGGGTRGGSVGSGGGGGGGGNGSGGNASLRGRDEASMYAQMQGQRGFVNAGGGGGGAKVVGNARGGGAGDVDKGMGNIGFDMGSAGGDPSASGGGFGNIAGGGKQPQEYSNRGKTAAAEFLKKNAQSASTAGRGDDYVARHPIVSMMGVNECVQRIVRFNEDQRKRKSWNNDLEQFWRPFVKKYFADDSKMLLDVANKKTKSSHSIELRAEILARVFKAKYDAGVEEEKLLLENPCEFLLYSGNIVLDCPRTIIMTIFPDSHVQTEGHLRVTFSQTKQILCWEFSTRRHEEYVKLDLPKQPQPAADDLGFPPAFSSYIKMAEAISRLRKNIISATDELANQKSGRLNNQSQGRRS